MDAIAVNKRTKCTTFSSERGAKEYFFVFETEEKGTFASCLKELLNDVEQTFKQFELNRDTVVFSRFYLSDIANQKDELVDSDVYEICSNSSHSIIEQAPLCAGTMSLLVYHVVGDGIERESLSMGDDKWRNALKIKGKHYTQYWTGNFTGGGVFDSYKQTDEIFKSYNHFISENGMTLFDNCVRTWIYVRDIDNHYAGMVDSRREYFKKYGLTEDTHYIASTGIEARLRDVDSLVSMDALAVDGIVPEQVVQMEALEYLNPTHEYGVTFERGTKIAYGDRDHFYISGTASIDKVGDVLHLGDVEKQAERTLVNIKALLDPHGAELHDMAYLIVYLRNLTVKDRVVELLRREVGYDIPLIVVRGAVCRPTWLIEIEGVGVKANTSDFPPFL